MRIIAHYIYSVIKNRELFLKRISNSLSNGGMFSFNGAAVRTWHLCFEKVFNTLGIDSGFIDDVIETKTNDRQEMVGLLQKYFGKVESIKLTNDWHYSDAQDLFDKLLALYPEQKKMLQKNEIKLNEYFATQIESQGELIVHIESEFWHCYK